MERTQNIDTRPVKENSSQTNHQNNRCSLRRRTFRTHRGLLKHLNFSQCQNNDVLQTIIEPEIRNNHSYGEGHNDGDQEMFYWNKVTGSKFEALIYDAYEKITQWK